MSTPSTSATATSCTYTATSYNTTNCTTSNPAVTVTTTTRALVIVTAQITASGASAAGDVLGWAGFAVSGATTLAAADSNALLVGSTGSSTGADATHGRVSVTVYLSALTAGSNTFTMQYKSTGGDSITIQNRSLTVIPLP
jgi:hypothetical protein